MIGLASMILAAAVHPATSSNPDPGAPPSTSPHADRHPPQDGAEQGSVALQLGYTADLWTVAHGGVDRRTRYLDNLDLTVAADLDRLGVAPRTKLFAYLLYNNGVRFSDGGVGDAQGVSNIETGVRALRLYEAWIEHEVGPLSAKVGLYDLNSEFDALDASAFFIGSAHGIGTDVSQTGRNGPSIFPVTSLAFRLQAQLDDGLIVRGAVLDGVPGDPDRPRRTAIRFGRGDGVLLIGEVDWTRGGLRLLAGHWLYTARFEVPVSSRVSGTPVRRSGNHGYYLRAETRLVPLGKHGQLDGFVRLGTAAGRFNLFDGFFGAGLVWSAPSSLHPDDQLGVALAIASTSPRQRALVEGDALLRKREIAVELSYEHHLSKNFSVQPDLQYIINPGLGATPDALAVALRFRFLFGR